MAMFAAVLAPVRVKTTSLRREGDVSDNPFRSRQTTNSGTIHEIHEMVPLDGESSALDPSPLYNGSISFHPPRIRKRRQRQS